MGRSCMVYPRIFMEIDIWKNYDSNIDSVIIYLKFIEDNANKDIESYSEVHHIVPRSIDSSLSNADGNLVRLSGRSHFIAHKLLVDCFNGKNKRRMIFALMKMCGSRQKSVYDVTPDEYESVRKECSSNMTGENNQFYGRKHSNESKKKISIALSNPSDLTRKRMSHSAKKRIEKYGVPFKGMVHSDETKKKISEKNKGRVRSFESRLKQSMSIKANGKNLGINNSMYGRHWYNNGVRSIAIKQGDIVPDGFVRGRILK